MKESSRLLTILIPTRNRYEMLISLLKKLEEEDNGIVRVVVSDNCSDEAGYENLPAICKSHVLDVSYQRHATEIAALENFVSLLQSIDTKFSCFLADDDYWEAGALSKIASIMKIRELEFSYADEWSLHDQVTGIEQERHKMYELKDSRIDNLIEFIRYDNDPHVYGVYRTELLKEASRYFRQSWLLLPPDYNSNVAFEALGFVFLSTDKLKFLPFKHSQGAAKSRLTVNRPPPLLEKVLRLTKASLVHLTQKTQLYFWMVFTVMRMGFGLIDGLRVLWAGVGVTVRSSPISAVIRRRLSTVSRAT